MDDLKEQGFRMADRTVGLDMKHCLLVMKTLAQSHAASAVLHLKDPEKFKPFGGSFYCDRHRKSLEKLYQNNIQRLTKVMENTSLSSDRFACKLHRLTDKTADILIKDLERNDNDFNVFVHGDLWTNNMMFRYSDDTDEVVDVR
jgi:thiamine kinase-like enzyme